MPISEIHHRGKNILFINYTPYKNKEDMLAQLQKVGEYYKNSTGKVRSLTDITGTFISPEFDAEIKRLSKEVFADQSEKAAVLGITGIKKILLDAFNLVSRSKTGIRAFRTKEEALDYLVN